MNNERGPKFHPEHVMPLHEEAYTLGEIDPSTLLSEPTWELGELPYEFPAEPEVNFLAPDMAQALEGTPEGKKFLDNKRHQPEFWKRVAAGLIASVGVNTAMLGTMAHDIERQYAELVDTGESSDEDEPYTLEQFRAELREILGSNPEFLTELNMGHLYIDYDLATGIINMDQAIQARAVFDRFGAQVVDIEDELEFLQIAVEQMGRYHPDVRDISSLLIDVRDFDNSEYQDLTGNCESRAKLAHSLIHQYRPDMPILFQHFNGHIRGAVQAHDTWYAIESHGLQEVDIHAGGIYYHADDVFRMMLGEEVTPALGEPQPDLTVAAMEYHADHQLDTQQPSIFSSLEAPGQSFNGAAIEESLEAAIAAAEREQEHGELQIVPLAALAEQVKETHEAASEDSVEPYTTVISERIEEIILAEESDTVQDSEDATEVENDIASFVTEDSVESHSGVVAEFDPAEVPILAFISQGEGDGQHWIVAGGTETQFEELGYDLRELENGWYIAERMTDEDWLELLREGDNLSAFNNRTMSEERYFRLLEEHSDVMVEPYQWGERVISSELDSLYVPGTISDIEGLVDRLDDMDFVGTLYFDDMSADIDYSALSGMSDQILFMNIRSPEAGTVLPTDIPFADRTYSGPSRSRFPRVVVNRTERTGHYDPNSEIQTFYRFNSNIDTVNTEGGAREIHRLSIIIASADMEVYAIDDSTYISPEEFERARTVISPEEMPVSHVPGFAREPRSDAAVLAISRGRFDYSKLMENLAMNNLRFLTENNLNDRITEVDYDFNYDSAFLSEDLLDVFPNLTKVYFSVPRAPDGTQDHLPSELEGAEFEAYRLRLLDRGIEVIID